jgi:hypothetical protein
VSIDRDFVERQWRYTKRFFVFFPFWRLLIAGINIWTDLDRGNPLDWRDAVYPAGMASIALLLYIFMKVIFKVVRRYVDHQDKRSQK